jgi:hypothetical protein
VTGQCTDQLDALEGQRQVVLSAAAARGDVAGETFEQIHELLQAREPVFAPPEIDFEADEDDDPLFDSRRDYLDQLAAYKRFQGKTPVAPDGEDDDDDIRIV